MKPPRVSFGSITALALFFTVFVALRTAAADRGLDAEAAELHAKAQRVQDVIDDLRGRLSLSRDVMAAIVPLNPLMVSVLAPAEHDGVYRVAFEGAFVDSLTDDELRAVVAHELGHVWIFTHHPFLQTEVLANQIAQRMVPRSSLVQVYEKVWKRQGTKGDLTRFVGD